MNGDLRMPTTPSPAKRATVEVRPGHPKGGRRSAFVLIGQGLAIVGMFLGSYLFFSHFVVQTVRVDGNSMLPNLRDSDVYVVNRLSSLFRAPQHGDIVVLKDPTDKTYAVKRVIGVEGDLVELRGGAVFVNKKRLVETYLGRGTPTFPFQTMNQVVFCGPGQFFVLGDNRAHSSDSRSYGAVSRKAILGFLIR